MIVESKILNYFQPSMSTLTMSRTRFAKYSLGISFMVLLQIDKPKIFVFFNKKLNKLVIFYLPRFQLQSCKFIMRIYRNNLLYRHYGTFFVYIMFCVHVGSPWSLENMAHTMFVQRPPTMSSVVAAANLRARAPLSISIVKAHLLCGVRGREWGTSRVLAIKSTSVRAATLCQSYASHCIARETKLSKAKK